MAASAPEKPRLYNFRKRVPDQNVGFLHARRVFAWHAQAAVAHVSQFSTASAGKADGPQVHRARQQYGAPHVDGISAGGDRYQHVVRAPKSFNLPHKYVFKAVV